MSVTKLPASTPVIKFTQTDLELLLETFTKAEYYTQLSRQSYRRWDVSVSL